MTAFGIGSHWLERQLLGRESGILQRPPACGYERNKYENNPWKSVDFQLRFCSKCAV